MMRKRLTAALLLCVMMFLCSCGVSRTETAGTKESVTDTAGSSTLPETAYLSTKLQGKVPMAYVQGLLFRNEKLYLYGWTEKRQPCIARCNPDGSEMETLFTYTHDLKLPSGAPDGGSKELDGGVVTIENLEISTDGELVFFLYREVLGQNGTELQNLLVRTDGTGKTRWAVMWKGNVGYGDLITVEEEILVCVAGTVRRYDAEGNLTGEMTLDVEDCQRIYRGTDSGSLYAECGTGIDECRLVQIDSGTGKVQKEMIWSEGSLYPQKAEGGASGYDFLMWNRKELVGWNVGDKACTKLISFSDSGVNADELNAIAAIGEKRFVTSEVSLPNVQALYLLSAEEGEKRAEKRLLTLGCMGGSANWLLGDVAEFNRTNEKYRIEVIQYQSEHLSGGEASQEKDILNGIVPDIFWVQSDEDIADYIRLGLLEDLYPWIDGDAEMGREDFLTNVFEAYQTGGALYQVPLCFAAEVTAVKSSVLGDASGLSPWDLERLRREYPDSRLFAFPKRAMLLREAVTYNWENFVDEEAHTCCFDGEEFLWLLEFLSEYPEDSEYPEEFVSDVESYRSETILTQNINLLSAFYGEDSFQRTEILFGGPVSYIGFPGLADSSGRILDRSFRLSMSAQSDCKEGAWEFIRYYLSEEYQNNEHRISPYGFPVRLSALERMAKQAQGQKVTDYPFYGFRRVPMVGGPVLHITPDPLTEKDTNRYLVCLKTLNRRNNLYENDLKWSSLGIIEEESQAYFLGQKTAAEAAAIIQSRVGLILQESK